MRIFLTLILFGLLPSPSIAQNKDFDAIKNVMDLQEKAWNTGDLKGFMQGYLQSEDLVFIGSKGVNKGWQTTLDNYIKSYPTQEAMGKLTFTLIKVEKSSKNSAWLVGKWELKRTKDTLGGHFLLVWKKIKGKWYIIADHSS